MPRLPSTVAPRQKPTVAERRLRIAGLSLRDAGISPFVIRGMNAPATLNCRSATKTDRRGTTLEDSGAVATRRGHITVCDPGHECPGYPQMSLRDKNRPSRNDA